MKSKKNNNEDAKFLYSGEPIKLTLGTLAVMAFCILLIIISTFTQFPIVDIFSLNKGQDVGTLLNDYLSNSFLYSYIPQIPAIFFVIALLDRRYGITTIIIYILLGLFAYPIFGMGGGINYILEYGFGYILAYIPGAFITATIIKHNYHFLNVLKGVVIGVLAIHLIGVMYMIFISTLFHTTADMISGWITSQSGIKVFYDIIFSMFSIYIANWVRRFLWLIMC